MPIHNMFESALRKVERANEHIAEFERTLKAFTDGHRHTVHVHGHKNGPMFFEIVFDAPLPPRLSLILSDAIHNLSAALDHATWELIGIDQGTQDRHTKLPTGDNRVNFEAACRGVRTPIQATIDLFIRLAIYPQGAGELIYWLRKLDNAEKHTILSPVAQVASVERIEFIELDTNRRWESENVILRPGPDGRSFIELEPGIGIDCNHRHRTTSDVFFGDVEGVSYEPIVPTLRHFRDAVSEILLQFKRSVVERYPGIPHAQRAALIG